jgi:hydrogenase expression/formation protein HypE
MDEVITLSYGSGGKKTSELIEEMLVPAFNNSELSKLNDGAILDGNKKLVFSTDSFVVSPVFFPGGNAGKLSVCGTVNDVCMCGGEPRYLSLGLIIEEGFKTSDLEKIIKSIKDTAAECNVKIVTGDTKVVERGKGDGIYINTAGIGFLKYEIPGKDSIRVDDRVIVTGTVGDHGITVMAARGNLIFGNDLYSDCNHLDRLSAAILKYGKDVRIIRDPTRGGVATTLNEFIENTEYSIELDEDGIPVKEAVNNACDILGLDPMYSANEGKIVAVVSKDAADSIINDIKKLPEGADAAIIGKVSKKYKGKVVLNTSLGGSRILTKLTGSQLPRIC